MGSGAQGGRGWPRKARRRGPRNRRQGERKQESAGPAREKGRKARAFCVRRSTRKALAWKKVVVLVWWSNRFSSSFPLPRPLFLFLFLCLFLLLLFLFLFLFLLLCSFLFLFLPLPLPLPLSSSPSSSSFSLLPETKQSFSTLSCQ